MSTNDSFENSYLRALSEASATSPTPQPTPTQHARPMKLSAISMARYFGGIATKRRWGSSTITEFLVTDEQTGRSVTVKAYGKTPGERKTFAMNRATEILKQQ
jgi:hypothetical protein